MRKAHRVLYTFFILLIALSNACTSDGNSTEQPEMTPEESAWISEIPIVTAAYDIQGEETKVQYKAIVPLGTFTSFYDKSLAEAGWERDRTGIVKDPNSEANDQLELFYVHPDGRALKISVGSDEEDMFLLHVTMEQMDN